MPRTGDHGVVGIGAFAQLTGLSIDALRHYHDVGLLIPASIDGATGYRRYRIDQAQRAAMISALRAADMSLAAIREVLDAATARDARILLLRHRRHLRAAAEAAARRIDELDRLIEGELAMTSDPHDALAAELLEMFETQQETGRRLFEQTRGARPDRFIFELPNEDQPEGWEEAARQAHAFAVRLDAIVDAHGWPDRTIVGDDGAAAAWAIAQHADGDNDLCERWLPQLADAVRRGDAPAVHLAALTDRVLLRAGRPQRYGTLVEPDGASWRLRDEIEDPEQLDERRREIGLGPVGDFLESLPTPDTWYAGETAQ